MTKTISEYMNYIMQKVRAALQRPSKDQWSKQLYNRNDSHYADARADGNSYNLKR